MLPTPDKDRSDVDVTRALSRSSLWRDHQIGDSPEEIVVGTDLSLLSGVQLAFEAVSRAGYICQNGGRSY